MTTTDNTDRMAPRELILPDKTTVLPAKDGQLLISGTYLYYFDGSNTRRISGAYVV